MNICIYRQFLLCTVDVVNPSIPHDFTAFKEALDKRGNKSISTTSHSELLSLNNV